LLRFTKYSSCHTSYYLCAKVRTRKNKNNDKLNKPNWTHTTLKNTIWPMHLYKQKLFKHRQTKKLDARQYVHTTAHTKLDTHNLNCTFGYAELSTST
jgi:hypothetical protein